MSTVKFNTWQNTDGTENYKCRAWVNFDGTTNTSGNCDIRASGNVSSVADNGTGDYTVNFSTALDDADYCFTFGVGDDTAQSANRTMAYHGGTRTSSALQIQCRVTSTAALADQNYHCITIFR